MPINILIQWAFQWTINWTAVLCSIYSICIFHIYSIIVVDINLLIFIMSVGQQVETICCIDLRRKLMLLADGLNRFLHPQFSLNTQPITTLMCQAPGYILARAMGQPDRSARLNSLILVCMKQAPPSTLQLLHSTKLSRQETLKKERS